MRWFKVEYNTAQWFCELSLNKCAQLCTSSGCYLKPPRSRSRNTNRGRCRGLGKQDWALQSGHLRLEGDGGVFFHLMYLSLFVSIELQRSPVGTVRDISERGSLHRQKFKHTFVKTLIIFRSAFSKVAMVCQFHRFSNKLRFWRKCLGIHFSRNLTLMIDLLIYTRTFFTDGLGRGRIWKKWGSTDFHGPGYPVRNNLASKHQLMQVLDAFGPLAWQLSEMRPFSGESKSNFTESRKQKKVSFDFSSEHLWF